jgi:hypothetical protein
MLDKKNIAYPHLHLECKNGWIQKQREEWTLPWAGAHLNGVVVFQGWKLSVIRFLASTVQNGDYS